MGKPTISRNICRTSVLWHELLLPLEIITHILLWYVQLVSCGMSYSHILLWYVQLLPCCGMRHSYLAVVCCILWYVAFCRSMLHFVVVCCILLWYIFLVVVYTTFILLWYASLLSCCGMLHLVVVYYILLWYAHYLKVMIGRPCESVVILIYFRVGCD